MTCLFSCSPCTREGYNAKGRVMSREILKLLNELDDHSFKNDIVKSSYFIDDENTEFYFMNYLRCIHFIKVDALNMIGIYSDDYILDYIRRYVADSSLLYNTEVALYSIEKG